MCIPHLGENGLEKYRLANKWEQFEIVLLFMDHPVVMPDIPHDRHKGGCCDTIVRSDSEHCLTVACFVAKDETVGHDVLPIRAKGRLQASGLLA